MSNPSLVNTNLINPISHPNQDDEKWAQFDQDCATRKTTLIALQEKMATWPAPSESNGNNLQTSLGGRLTDHTWKVIGGVVGAAFAGTIAKTLLCWTCIKCAIGFLSGMAAGSLIGSRFDTKQTKQI